jgi:plasmid stabilization system protein ParE
MAYKLIVTKRAEVLLDNIVYHLLYRLKNKQAVKHLFDGIENVYDRLEKNPEQFPISRDSYLAAKGYREAVVPEMNYIIIFSIGTNVVNVVGIFHQLEDYQRKL